MPSFACSRKEGGEKKKCCLCNCVKKGLCYIRKEWAFFTVVAFCIAASIFTSQVYPEKWHTFVKRLPFWNDKKRTESTIIFFVTWTIVYTCFFRHWVYPKKPETETQEQQETQTQTVAEEEQGITNPLLQRQQRETS